MAERTEGTITIEGPARDVLDVIVDFDAYPEWAGVKTAEVVETDRNGWPTKVAMSVSQMGVEASYTLAYEYYEDDGGLSWTSVEASGVVKRIDGEYVLEDVGSGRTKVTYRLATELAMPLPGFLKRQGEKQVISAALDGLKSRVERG
jgi:hypothetical protein